MFNRPLVIVGPDGSGKSTLARDLSIAFLTKPQHFNGRPDSAKVLMTRENKIRGEVKHCNNPRIYDRYSPICEQIYTAALDRVPLLSEEQYESLIWATLPVIIFCQLPDQPAELSVEDKDWKSEEFLEEVLGKRDQIAHFYNVMLQHLMQSNYPYLYSYKYDEVTDEESGPAAQFVRVSKYVPNRFPTTQGIYPMLLADMKD